MTRMVPESGVRSPMTHSTVVVLPAPLGPEDTEDLALRDRERDVVDRDRSRVRLTKVLDDRGPAGVATGLRMGRCS